MKVTTESSHELAPAHLAKALAECSPDEFAAFWLAFDKECHPEKLDEFAKAMAPDFGGARKQPLKELYSLMKYHEIRFRRHGRAPE